MRDRMNTSIAYTRMNSIMGIPLAYTFGDTAEQAIVTSKNTVTNPNENLIKPKANAIEPTGLIQRGAFQAHNNISISISVMRHMVMGGTMGNNSLKMVSERLGGTLIISSASISSSVTLIP